MTSVSLLNNTRRRNLEAKRVNDFQETDTGLRFFR